MKLFRMDIMDNGERKTEMRIGNSAEEIQNEMLEENNYTYLMWVTATEIIRMDDAQLF